MISQSSTLAGESPLLARRLRSHAGSGTGSGDPHASAARCGVRNVDRELLGQADWLHEEKVLHVAMGSTGAYWKSDMIDLFVFVATLAAIVDRRRGRPTTNAWTLAGLYAGFREPSWSLVTSTSDRPYERDLTGGSFASGSQAPAPSLDSSSASSVAPPGHSHRPAASATQCWLARRTLGYIHIDGVFGPVTQDRRRAIPTRQRPAADCIVGPAAWAALRGDGAQSRTLVGNRADQWSKAGARPSALYPRPGPESRIVGSQMPARHLKAPSTYFPWRSPMSDPTSVAQIDLTPIPGKTYFSIDREWRQEFIYFLMVDRFQDETGRPVAGGTGRASGVDTPDAFFGGKIAGITKNLAYIAGLGCTAIGLSPIFENNGNSYHGYDINNYLSIDPRFGTKNDLIDLVDTAHCFTKNGKAFPIRIILDVVVNHSGDNWFYPGGFPFFYSNNQQVRVRRVPATGPASAHGAGEPRLVPPEGRDAQLRYAPGKPVRRHIDTQGLCQRRRRGRLRRHQHPHQGTRLLDSRGRRRRLPGRRR